MTSQLRTSTVFVAGGTGVRDGPGRDPRPFSAGAAAAAATRVWHA